MTFAYYEAEQDRMKALEIDKGEGCVAPTAETIADGSYPLVYGTLVGADGTTALGNSSAGINLDSWTRNSTFSGNTIANNGGSGLFFDRRNTATVDSINITNNLIDSNALQGIEIKGRQRAA